MNIIGVSSSRFSRKDADLNVKYLFIAKLPYDEYFGFRAVHWDELYAEGVGYQNTNAVFGTPSAKNAECRFADDGGVIKMKFNFK